MAARPHQIALTLPPKQREALDALCACSGRTRSSYIIQAVDEYLRRQHDMARTGFELLTYDQIEARLAAVEAEWNAQPFWEKNRETDEELNRLIDEQQRRWTLAKEVGGN